MESFVLRGVWKETTQDPKAEKHAPMSFIAKRYTVLFKVGSYNARHHRIKEEDSRERERRFPILWPINSVRYLGNSLRRENFFSPRTKRGNINYWRCLSRVVCFGVRVWRMKNEE